MQMPWLHIFMIKNKYRSCFGKFTDQFDIQWQIICDAKLPKK